MPIRSLQLTRAQAACLRRLAEEAYPAEACGLLVGTGEADIMTAEIVPTANVAAEPRRRFEVAPQAQFDLLRRLRGGPLRIIGHYHSHPDGEAALSAHDLAMAHDPGAIWVLVPVTTGRAQEPLAFVCPATDRAEPVTVEVIG